MSATDSAFTEIVSGTTFLALDIETTELPPAEPGKDSTFVPIAIGLAVGLNGTLRARKHWLINPGPDVVVDLDSTAYHGITTDDLADAADTKTVLAALNKFVSRYPTAMLLVHNASFDVGLLNDTFDGYDLDRPGLDVIYTITVSKTVDPDKSRRRALPALCDHYGINNRLRGASARVRKAEKDARDTLDLWWALVHQAGAAGYTELDELLNAVGITAFEAVTFKRPTFRRSELATPIPAEHNSQAHGHRLPDQPSAADWTAFRQELADCVSLRCFAAGAKMASEHEHFDKVWEVATSLLGACTGPGQAGTLLGAMTAIVDYLPMRQARLWTRRHASTLQALPACKPGLLCPSCLVGAPCPIDVFGYRLAGRMVTYPDGRGLTERSVDEDLYRIAKKTAKINTWSTGSMRPYLSHVLYLVVSEYMAAGRLARARQILLESADRQLHFDDPALALLVAKYWSGSGQFGLVDQINQSYKDRQSTDPSVSELQRWLLDSLPKLQARASKVNTPREVKTTNPLRRRPDREVYRHPYQVF